MNRIRKLSPAALVFAGLLLLAGAVIGSHGLDKVFAQQGVVDKTAGFQGSFTSAAGAVVVSATTIQNAGTPVISPPSGTAPGFAVANARIHVKHVNFQKHTAGTIAILEHPSTGSDVVICIVGVLADTPYDGKQGNGELLGVNGYLTAAGSSIKLLVNDNSGVLTAGTITYSLE